MFLPYNKIKEIEIELTGICNLSCPLCTRNYSHANHQKHKNIRPLEELIKQFDLFPELNHINIAGTVSEPTLYPYILEFVEYLLQRNPEIEIDFYSNASILDENLWKSLGKLFQHPNQRMIFTVCGSTQELHQKYRVGSKLENILQNASWFREYSKNDECQYIIFEYNQEDSESEETKKLVNSFSKHFFIESEGRRLLNEYNKSFSKDIYPNKTRAKAINTLFVKGEKLFENKEHKPVQISCISFEQKRIYIDQFGKIFACYNQAEYYPDSYIKFSVEPISKNKLDFTSIKNFGYKDCLKCEKNIRKMIDVLELDFVC